MTFSKPRQPRLVLYKTEVHIFLSIAQTLKTLHVEVLRHTTASSRLRGLEGLHSQR
jgi:hypothetical protein